MKPFRISALLTILIGSLVLLVTNNIDAKYSAKNRSKKDLPGPLGVMVMDGSCVHNVGQLRMHIANWGIFGSRPLAGLPWSDAPSAEWPPGSRVEHLYEAGLWVGAIKNGVPAVTTASVQNEFRPTDNPLDTIYRSYEDAPGGNRLPSPDADDDLDGSRDEDWLDGHDNDLDGQTDEDFAAISDQMFSCWFADTAAVQWYPEHNPLGLMVRQETYQWQADGYDKFVGVVFRITNIGPDTLEGVHVGLFADPDIGNRDLPNYWEDDAVGHFYDPAVCTNRGPVALDMAYGYDANGDGGQAPGYIGLMFLGHPVDWQGLAAPDRVGIQTYASFQGIQSYPDGGDPTNDFERYALLASQTIERNASTPRDYRLLIGTGPFAVLLPGSTLVVEAALAVGSGLSGLMNSAASAQLTYNGAWFNQDGDPLTGIDRREEPVPGPGVWVIIDSCRAELSTPVYNNSHDPIWINRDCAQEEFFKTECLYTDADSLFFRTGVAGKEAQIHWIAGDEVPVPTAVTSFRASPTETGVELSWDVSAIDGLAGFNVYRREEGKRILILLNSNGLISADKRTYIDKTGRPGQTYNYTLGLIRKDNSELRSETVTVTTNAPALELHQNYPNPFNPSTTVSFTLPERTQVNLSVFDLSGRLVKTLLDTNMSEGFKEVQWNGLNNKGSAAASGIYLIRLKAGTKSLTRKMILLR